MRTRDEASIVAHLLAFITGTRIFAQVVAGYCLIQGISIIIGSEDRFSASAYSYVRLFPGEPYVWGYWLLIAGLMILAGISSNRDILASIGAYLASLWSLFFAVSFMLAAATSGDANLTGMWAYGKDVVIFFLLAKTLRSYGKREENSKWMKFLGPKN